MATLEAVLAVPSSGMSIGGPHRRRYYLPEETPEVEVPETDAPDITPDPDAPEIPETPAETEEPTQEPAQVDDGADAPDEDADVSETPEIPEDATTVNAVIDWVNDAESFEAAKVRAQVALDAENSRDGGPRVTLVTPLEDLLTTPSTPA